MKTLREVSIGSTVKVVKIHGEGAVPGTLNATRPQVSTYILG